MISTPTSQLLGPANSFADYESLTSGWALGTAFDAGRWNDPLNWLERQADQTVAGQGIRRPDWRSWTPSRGSLMVEPDTPLLDPEDANKRYGIAGALSWDKPVREGEAKLLRQWKEEEIRQADVLARATPGFAAGTGRFLAMLAGGNSDPLSLGSNFVPVLQEARWAQLAGAVGKVGMRVIRGAAEGAAGALVTEPIALYQAGRQQADYSASDSALNVAFGMVAGAGLRTIGGAGADLLKRWRSAPVELRDAAVNQAAAALVTGTPIRTDEILGAVTALETPRVRRPGVEVAGSEKSLDVIAFVQSKGGVVDTEGHDLRNAVGQRMNPRYGALLRTEGKTIDEIGEALHEAGYFGDPSSAPRPTVAQVVDLLREAAGRKVYSELANVSATVDESHARGLAGEELSRVADEMGVRVSEVEQSAALDLMMSQGVSASDALDHVLERSAIEGGTFTSTAQRLADVQARIEQAQEGGAPLRDIAPLLDERAALQADLAAERLPQVGETIRGDLRGEAPGSLDYAGQEASRAADQSAKAALPITEAVEHARAARVNAETHFRALGGDLLPAEIRAMDDELQHIQAKRQAALSLAGCMIREGV